MGNEHKDIKITPNTSQSASPKIEVTGANNATKTITINDDGTISFDSTIAATSGSVANGNANLVTGDAVFDYIALQGYTTNTGDITGVDLTGGTGVTIGSETGTTSGNYSATISIGQAVGTGDNVTFANVTIADDIIHSGDTNNLISFGTDTQSFETGGTARMNISDSGLQIGSGARVTTINTSFSDNNTSLMTSAAIDDRIQSFGYTTNTGDITGVDLTGGTGVTIGSETNTGSGAYSSTISIGQAVGTSDDVTFSTLTLASDLIHSGDTNNKISFGTDTQSFQTAGTARLTIGSDGKIQIGPSTVNPSGITTGKVTISRDSTDESTDGPTLMLVDGDDDASPGPVIKLYRNTASPADNDVIGQLLFSGEDSAGGERTYGSISARTLDITSGTRDSEILLKSTKDGSDITTLTLHRGAVKFNDAYTFPTSDGSANQVLQTDGSGSLSFATVSGGSTSPAGSDGQIQYNNGGSFGGDAEFVWDDTNERLVIGSVTSQHDSLQKLTIKGSDAGMLIEKHDDGSSGGPTLALYRYSASEADGDLIGQVTFRGEGSTGNPSTYMMLRAEILDVTEGTKDGQFIFRGLQANTQTDFMTVGSNGVRNMIGSVVAVSSNTTLTDEQSGSYVYWTGGTLTLPATAIKGQQYTIINNTNGSATPALGTSNSIATNWTAHAAMSDETARTYVAVAANTWIYVG